VDSANVVYEEAGLYPVYCLWNGRPD
jgi:hypothetical protein